MIDFETVAYHKGNGFGYISKPIFIFKEHPMPHPLTMNLQVTPVIKIEERRPHLAGTKPVVDHRGNPQFRKPQLTAAEQKQKMWEGAQPKGANERPRYARAQSDLMQVRTAAALVPQQPVEPAIEAASTVTLHSLLARLALRIECAGRGYPGSPRPIR
jgi:hypothetical protein